MLKNWRKWVEKIAQEAAELLPDAKVYVVGSVARGDYVASSDVDVLVVSDRVPEKPADRSRIKLIIEEKLNLPPHHPFEIHLLTKTEAKHYLKRSSNYIIQLT